MRKVFAEELLYKKFGKKMVVDWEKSIGKEIKFVYDNVLGNVKIANFDTSHVYVLYKDKEYKITKRNFLLCKIYNIVNERITGFKFNVGDIVKANDGNEVKIIDRFKKESVIYPKTCSKGKFYVTKKYKYKCLHCGNEDVLSEERMNNSTHICNVCFYRPAKALKGYNDFLTEHPELEKYLVNKEDGYKFTSGSAGYVLVKCLNCGYQKNIKVCDLVNKRKFNCPICGDTNSYPEKLMLALLEFRNIKNIYQLTRTTFEWCGNYRYDFYLPDYNCIIETHGMQHYKKNTFEYLGGKTLEEKKENDKNKRCLAMENGVKYIAIDCRYNNMDYIINNIKENKTLNAILKADDIKNKDKILIGDRISKSLVKEICLYKGFRKDISLSDISKKFNISHSSVKRYISIGIDMKWCSYNIEDSRKLGIKKSSKSRKGKPIVANEKPVICYEINKEFCSINECVRYFRNTFCIELDGSTISRVCNKKKGIKKHKGYTFDFIPKQNNIA